MLIKKHVFIQIVSQSLINTHRILNFEVTLRQGGNVCEWDQLRVSGVTRPLQNTGKSVWVREVIKKL